MRIYLCCIYPIGVLFLNILPESPCKMRFFSFLYPLFWVSAERLSCFFLLPYLTFCQL